MTRKCSHCGALLEGVVESSPVSFLNPDLTIKHMFPKPRRMIADYQRMFSPLKSLPGLKALAAVVGVLGAMWLILLFGPSTRDPATNILLRVFAFFNAYFVLGFSAVIAFGLISPLLTRLILPLCNLVAEIAKEVVCFVLFGIQYVLFDLLCEQIERLFSYVSDDDTP